MKRRWFKLDNVAKIFPPSSSKRDPKVFRFTCVLKDDINKDILQEATNEALEYFPNFSSILKQGFFWHYLETTNKKPIVKEERKEICSPLYRKNKKKLLFRVNYYKNRINLEVYHALSDGTGALEFLKMIVNIYLNKKYNLGELINLDYDASLEEKNADSFNKYYKSANLKNEVDEKAYKIKGEKFDDYRFKVITGTMNVKDMLDLAHNYHTTLTGLVVGIYIWAIRENMNLKDKDKPIYVDIPVNLRKYFKSQTARNFFSVLKLKYKGSDELESIIKYVDDYLKKELKQENLFKRMNKFATIEHNFLVRLVPLFIKNIILKFANYLSNKDLTTSVTNLGVVKIPDEIKDYIDSFEVYVSTDKMQISLCSYLDKLNISFTSVFISTDIIKDFYRKLASFGIDITIISNKIE